jgi:hypothetical protein
MPQASKKRRRQVRHLAAESRMTASVNMGQPLLRQVLHVSRVSLRAGNPPPLGHTALTNAFATYLDETISASPSANHVEKGSYQGTRSFVCQRGAPKHFVKRSSTISMPAPGPRLGRPKAGHIGAPEANSTISIIVTPIIAENVCDRGP